ncbi:MAG: uroporphyrinogen-III synthase [Chloroflexi bacterium]|nr:uroporphyrinogen-III synthase [Chloroflexota bacterium]
MKPTVVLNTRPREQSGELSKLLHAAGFEVVEAPAIAIVPAWDAAVLEQIRGDLARGVFDWVVLPSQNAGRGLETELRRGAARVLCGTATARGLDVPAGQQLERFSAAAALDLLRTLVSPGQHVLVPRAAEGREELVDGLRELHVTVVAPVAYTTVGVEAAADRLRHGDIDVLTVCSPSAVSTTASAVTGATRLVCLGHTTADAARAHGLRVDGVAARPTMAALVDTVESCAGVRV